MCNEYTRISARISGLQSISVTESLAPELARLSGGRGTSKWGGARISGNNSCSPRREGGGSRSATYGPRGQVHLRWQPITVQHFWGGIGSSEDTAWVPRVTPRPSPPCLIGRQEFLPEILAHSPSQSHNRGHLNWSVWVYVMGATGGAAAATALPIRRARLSARNSRPTTTAVALRPSRLPPKLPNPPRTPAQPLTRVSATHLLGERGVRRGQLPIAVHGRF